MKQYDITHHKQVGAFYTFSRDHSARGTAPQELYLWESVTAAAKNALEMRYRLLPYMYTLFHAAHTTGGIKNIYKSDE
jgi:alpha-glucosidase